MTAEELIDVYLSEGMTTGLRNAYSRLEGRFKCDDCGLVMPKYKGRYPGVCPECGGMEFEDLQNSPRYSEANEVPDYHNLERKRQQEKDRRAMDAQMRRVPQDRVPLGGPDHYEL